MHAGVRDLSGGGCERSGGGQENQEGEGAEGGRVRGSEETGLPEATTPARIEMWLNHVCGRNRTHDACTAVLKEF